MDNALHASQNHTLAARAVSRYLGVIPSHDYSRLKRTAENAAMALDAAIKAVEDHCKAHGCASIKGQVVREHA